MVSGRGVASPLPSTSGAAPPALSGPGNCHQLGEVRPQAVQQGSLSRDADRHHSREGLSDGLSDYQIPRSCRQVPSLLVTAAISPHGS